MAPITSTRYDAASRVTSIETPETGIHYGYNDANRVVWEDQILLGYPTRHLEKAPDADGNPTQLLVTTNGVADFLVHYDYTQRHQLAHITGNDYSPLYSYTYDSAGNMTRCHGEIIGDSANAPSAYYDALNRPTYWEQTRGSDAGFSGQHYQYDKIGREVAVWRDEDGNKGERFTFNTANHMTRAVYKADNAGTENPTNWERFRDYHYTPDLLNWTSVNDNGYLAPLEYNGINQYTSINGFVPQYDGNFNQTTTIYGPSFVYNALNQVAGGSMQCTYDGLGRCLKRTIGNNTIVFAYDGWKPVAEYDGGGNLHARNIYGPGPDELLMRGDSSYGWFFYHADKQESVNALVDLSGNVVEKYSYDAFGRPTVTNADGSGARSYSNYGNRFMYTGREWLWELNLYDYRHRLYNPDNGRFLQTDPTGFDAGDMNLFRYCDDDPVDRSDPSGLLADHTYERQLWLYGSNFQGSFAEFEQSRHPAGVGDSGIWSGESRSIAWQDEGKKGSPTVYHIPATAAWSIEKKVAANARSDKTTESLSVVGQAENGSANYVTSNPHPGNGFGNNVKNSQFNGKAQYSRIDQHAKYLPVGYRHIVGFVLGHIYYDRTFVAKDINIAIQCDYKVAIIVGEMHGAGDKVIVYEKDKPLPRY
ncbi:MAG: hypothetical protein DME97_12560 [Verrucomicrobia bacterium]|nr:MAG: hypothetical protein DME97_12560 [Verrucomicrobiota bacterium]